MKTKILTDEVYELIPSLVEQGLTRVEIAQRIGCTPSTLQVRCCQRGISLRRGGRLAPIVNYSLTSEVVPINENVLKILRQVARDMNKLPEQLVGDLIEKIVHDNLFSAVLDEEVA